MKYFLSGATGFIGGRLAQRLASEGHTVNAIVRNPGKTKDLSAPGIRIFPGDITDKDSLYAPMEGVDGVYHVAAWYKVGARDKSMANAINVNGTRNVLEAMKELKIRKGVYTSTLAKNSDTHGKLVDETYRYDGCGRHRHCSYPGHGEEQGRGELYHWRAGPSVDRRLADGRADHRHQGPAHTPFSRYHENHCRTIRILWKVSAHPRTLFRRGTPRQRRGYLHWRQLQGPQGAWLRSPAA